MALKRGPSAAATATAMNQEAVQADKQLQLLLRTATNPGAQQVQFRTVAKRI